MSMHFRNIHQFFGVYVLPLSLDSCSLSKVLSSDEKILKAKTQFLLLKAVSDFHQNQLNKTF